MKSLTLVTGASSNHFRSLKNLLYCISVFEPETLTIIYDLGLQPHEVQELQEYRHNIRRFPFELYPPHLNIHINSGQYAWKAVIVADTLRHFGPMVLWMDAGNLLFSRLNRIRDHLVERGLYCPRSSGDVARWTHPMTLEYMRVSPHLYSKVNRNAAFVGFNAEREGIYELAERWKACALDVNCIAPEGSNRQNHRQDQAVLTVLIYQFQEKYGYHLENEPLDVSAHNDGLSLEEVRKQIAPRMDVDSKSSQEQKAVRFLSDNELIYQQIGHSCRLISFLPDGRIGKGSGPHEKFWDVKAEEQELHLHLYSNRGLSCVLKPTVGGGWQGKLLEAKEISIEIIPKALCRL